VNKKPVAAKPLGGRGPILWLEEMSGSSRSLTDAYGLSPEPSVSHRITITNSDNSYACDCGVRFVELVELERHQHGLIHGG
jgi:hypothetical protein